MGRLGSIPQAFHSLPERFPVQPPVLQAQRVYSRWNNTYLRSGEPLPNVLPEREDSGVIHTHMGEQPLPHLGLGIRQVYVASPYPFPLGTSFPPSEGSRGLRRAGGRGLRRRRTHRPSPGRWPCCSSATCPTSPWSTSYSGPCRLLCILLVTENSSSPALITRHSAVRPMSVIKGTRVLRISATPPPKGVALKWSTRLPRRGSARESILIHRPIADDVPIFFKLSGGSRYQLQHRSLRSGYCPDKG